MRIKYRVIGRKSKRHKKFVELCYGLNLESNAAASVLFFTKKGYVDCKIEAYETSETDYSVALSEIF